MKPWINMPFLIQPEKLQYLYPTLDALKEWDVKEMRISIYLNECPEINIYRQILTKLNKNIDVKVYNVTGQPMLLPWMHKRYIKDFLNSDFTHFIYTDADITIGHQVIKYWDRTREFFKENDLENFIPGTFRIETFEGVEYSSEFTDRVDYSSLPIINIEGKPFFRPQQPFQGICIFDKKLAAEHLDSVYYYPALDRSNYRFGFIETCISGYILDNVPPGLRHRVLYPLDDYKEYWIYHLPANYAANPDTKHGKMPAEPIFEKIRERRSK